MQLQKLKKIKRRKKELNKARLKNKSYLLNLKKKAEILNNMHKLNSIISKLKKWKKKES